MPDLYAPAGRDFVDRCHSNPLCKFVCKFCAIGCVLWRFLVVLCGVLWLFLRHKTSNFSDFIVLNQNGTLIYLVYLIFSLVPSARLELAQLSPLPPQDSVSTSSTTTARQSVGL